MLERMQLFPLNFYKKAKFNGSMGAMNFRLGKEEKETEDGEKETILVGKIGNGHLLDFFNRHTGIITLCALCRDSFRGKCLKLPRRIGKNYAIFFIRKRYHFTESLYFQ